MKLSSNIKFQKVRSYEEKSVNKIIYPDTKRTSSDRMVENFSYGLYIRKECLVFEK